MRVYVETNFILEVVFEQKQANFIEGIVNLSETRKIKLIIPAFALIEPYWNLVHEVRGRRNILNQLSEKLNESKKRVPQLLNKIKN